MGGKRIIVTKEQLNEIIHLYVNDHLSCGAISSKFNSCEQKIARLLKKNGVKIRSYNDYHVLSEELTERVINLYSQNMSLLKISESVNLTVFKIRKILKENGIKVRTSSEYRIKPLTRDSINEIIFFYEQNKSLDEIMSIFHISYSKLINTLKQEGVLKKRKATFSTTQEQDDEMVKLYKESTLSCSKIAAILGVKASIVSKRIGKLKIARTKFLSFSDLDNDFILSEYSRGESTANIAKNLQVSEKRVRKTVKKNLPTRKKTKISKEVEGEIVKMYSVDGLKYIEIADKLNLTISNISTVLRRNRVNPTRKRKFNGVSQDEKEYILNWYVEKKKTVEWIQRQTGIPAQRIKEFLIDSKLKIKTSGGFNRADLTEIDKDTLVSLYESKTPLKELMNKFRVKVQTLFKILKEKGCKIRDRKTMVRKAQDLTEEDRVNILKFIKEGVTVDEIVKLLPKGTSPMKVKEFLKDHFKPEDNSPIYLWRLRCSPEVAERKIKEMKEKQLAKKKGRNSVLYGKPARNSAGKGWKGWYKGVFFRSLRELSYMLYLDEKQIKWESAERKRFTVEYKNYDGGDRTYRPDFFVNNEKLVEIKPTRLHSTPRVMLKASAAKKKCSEMGLSYEMIDFSIDRAKIEKALNEGFVEFYGDYEKRFREYKEKAIEPKSS